MEDLYAAVDDCKDKLYSEINKKKNKKQTMFKKGASKIKDMVRSWMPGGEKE